MCSSLELVVERGDSSGDVSGMFLRDIFGLAEQTPCIDYTMFPFMVSSADGKYAVELARAIMGQVQ